MHKQYSECCVLSCRCPSIVLEIIDPFNMIITATYITNLITLDTFISTAFAFPDNFAFDHSLSLRPFNKLINIKLTQQISTHSEMLPYIYLCKPTHCDLESGINLIILSVSIAHKLKSLIFHSSRINRPSSAQARARLVSEFTVCMLTCKIISWKRTVSSAAIRSHCSPAVCSLMGSSRLIEPQFV
jgi:hypothetical protein